MPNLDRKYALRGVVIATPEGLKAGGGIGSVTRTIKSWLEEHRPDIKVDALDPRGLRLAMLWPLRLVLTAMQLIAIRITRRPEILHLQVSRKSSFTRKGVLMAVARILGMRVVVHHHGSAFIDFYNKASGPMRSWVRCMVHTADINIVLGERSRNFLIQELQTNPDKIVVRFNATHDVGATGPRSNDDPWNLLIMANLSPRKGVSELLKAVAELARRGHPVRLTLAGSGEIERYRAEVQELGIVDRCVFTGWISGPAVDDLFLSHGIMVLPSYAEGLPMAIIEALSAKTPVIATPVGNIPELLKDGKSCLFVAPGSVDDIVAAVERMAGSPALRTQLTDAGRQLYETRFEVDNYMTQLLELYQAVLRGERPQDELGESVVEP